jgi:hypothetical protein
MQLRFIVNYNFVVLNYILSNFFYKFEGPETFI